jgi:hypothetical protein
LVMSLVRGATVTSAFCGIVFLLCVDVVGSAANHCGRFGGSR